MKSLDTTNIKEMKDFESKIPSASETMFLIPAIDNNGRLEPKNIEGLKIYVRCLNSGAECFLLPWLDGDEVLTLPKPAKGLAHAPFANF